MITLLGEANEAVATGNAGDWVSHDLSRLAGRESVLEERNKHKFIDLWSKITDKDGVLSRTFITAVIGEQGVALEAKFGGRLPPILKSTTGSPVQLEWAI